MSRTPRVSRLRPLAPNTAGLFYVTDADWVNVHSRCNEAGLAIAHTGPRYAPNCQRTAVKAG